MKKLMESGLALARRVLPRSLRRWVASSFGAAAPQDESDQATRFTRDELRSDPARVHRELQRVGTVIVTDKAGRPRLTISRQVDELGVQ
jgi:hypothetical protein